MCKRMICFRNVAILLLVVGFTACSSAYGSEKTSLQIENYEKGLEAFASGDTGTGMGYMLPLAREGYADAQTTIGILFKISGVVDEAEKWLTLAAEQGHAKAQYTLGDLYSSSDYEIKNNKSAMKWFTLAAEQGLFEAQNKLGLKYRDGEGAIQDFVKSHMWFNLAASSEHKYASAAASNRDFLAEDMTPSQLEKAQDLARECVAKDYKGC